MSEAIIETLTCIHTGSGNSLSANTEFVYFPDEQQIAVIDDQKILSIIGEENISQWVSVIEKKENLLDFLQKRKNIIAPDDIAKRVLSYSGDILKSSLSEQIHSGINNMPIVPGSSIKGAIRTAIIATKALENSSIAREVVVKNNRILEKLNDKNLLKNIVGQNSNDNLFRFLQIGDAHFKCQTKVVTSKILNLNYDKYNFKKGNEQLIECIPAGSVSKIRFKIDRNLLKKNTNIPNKGLLEEHNRLFSVINNHTNNLLEKEIDFWIAEIEEFSVPEIVDDYIEKLKSIKSKISELSENEAIFRLGFGSGWNFITGRWVKDERILKTDDLYDHFVSAIRRKRYSPDVPFPKTRKMISTQYGILGFVKLKLK